MPDVGADARYLACSLETQSEIVVPIIKGGAFWGEIDIDSDRPDAFGPDDVEFLEAVARLIAETLGRPYIVTLTGTDVYEALQDTRKEETVSSLINAAAVVAFHESIEGRLFEAVPELAGKTSVIAQGVELPGCDYPHHKEFNSSKGDLVVLLPSGIRPVKNVAFALPLLAKIHERGAGLYFVLIGPILHRGYAAEILAEIERFPFAHYFGEVGHNAIRGEDFTDRAAPDHSAATDTPLRMVTCPSTVASLLALVGAGFRRKGSNSPQPGSPIS